MTAAAAADSLAEGERAKLLRLAEILIPATAAMPSGAEILARPGVVDAVLRRRPDLAGPLQRILARFEGAPEAFVEDLAETDPDSLTRLLEVVAGAYYMDAGICAALGYPGQGG